MLGNGQRGTDHFEGAFLLHVQPEWSGHRTGDQVVLHESVQGSTTTELVFAITLDGMVLIVRPHEGIDVLTEPTTHFRKPGVGAEGLALVHRHRAEIPHEQFHRGRRGHQHTGVETHLREHVRADLGSLFVPPDQLLQSRQGLAHDDIKRILNLHFLLQIDDILVGQGPSQELVQALCLTASVQMTHDGRDGHTVGRTHDGAFPLIGLGEPLVHQTFHTGDRLGISHRYRLRIVIEALHLGDRCRMKKLMGQRFR